MIAKTTTLNLDISDVKNVIAFLQKNELLQSNGSGNVDWLIEKKENQKKSTYEKIIHGYLFFRIPLFRPDSFLKKVLPYVNFYFNRYFIYATCIALAIGLWGIYRQWDIFSSTLVDTFSINGIAHYASALFIVKIFHEFGHALTAKRFGCHVPTMGVAFLVMMPMAYTDVTEGWKLNSHRKRLAIAIAGIRTELIIASWATFFWFFLATGNIREIAFFLATTSLTTTILVNASPFMRFDGYYILSDLIGMPNLQERCFALARWWLRELLFQFGDDSPEILTKPKRLLMIGFAMLCVLYRAIVFFGIALLVYNFFFKILGVILFIIEIWYFLLRPCVLELKIWRKRTSDTPSNLRKKPVFYFFWIFVITLFVPFDFTVNAGGLLKPAQSLNLIAPIASRIEDLPQQPGIDIPVGQKLLALASPNLEYQIALSEIKVANLEKLLSSSSVASDNVAQLPRLREQYQSALEERKGLVAERDQLKPISQFAGRIIETFPDIEVGDWIPKGFKIATFANTKNWIVDAYVEESDLIRIAKDSRGKFIADTPGIQSIDLVVLSIDYDSSRTLTDIPLASSAGGPIVVRHRNNSVVPEKSIYRVRLSALNINDQISTGYLRGSVVIYGWPRSLFGEAIRGGLSTLLREAGF
jgi:putative peptide zinc metalloprotease protein